MGNSKKLFQQIHQDIQEHENHILLAYLRGFNVQSGIKTSTEKNNALNRLKTDKQKNNKFDK